MAAAFVNPCPSLLFSSNSVSNRCSRRPPTHRQTSATGFAAVTSSIGSGQAGGHAHLRDDTLDQRESRAVEDEWRRGNSLLVREADTNGTTAAVHLLHAMIREGTAVTQNFNQVVSILASRGRFEDGLALAEDAARRGVANIITFRPLMKQCCSAGNGRGAKRVWRVLSQCGIEGDMFLYAELMGALVRSQDMVSAQKVVESLRDAGRRPHVVLYNTLLKGYARRADVKRGFEVLEVIEESGIRPDETTFNTLLNICVRAKDPDAVNKTMNLMQRYRVKPGAPTFNTLLKLYARVGKFEHALEIYEEMQQTVEPSIVTYNTLIDGCAHRGNMDQAAHFFDEMIARGMTPDICTMTSLLKGFGRAKDPDRAVELYEAMKDGGYVIEERTRYAVINACLRGNDRQNAKQLMIEMIDSGLPIRARTWIWLLESDVCANDEKASLDSLRLMYSCGASLDSATKSAMMKEIRDRGGFVRFQRELKAVTTKELPEKD